MEYEHVINGLLRRCQEVADKLDVAQGAVRRFVLGIDALDATIRLFQPDAPIDLVRVRLTPRRHQAMRGENSRLMLRMLGEAGDAGLTTRDILLRVMEVRASMRPTRESMRRCGSGLVPTFGGCGSAGGCGLRGSPRAGVR